jgi:quinol monooxygenase YgiN
MTAYVIIATIEMDAGDVDRYQAALAAHRERSLKDEPGTLQFDVLRPSGDDAKLMIYEVYADKAAFQAHRDGASMKRIIEETEDVEITLSLIRCSRLD